MFLLRETNLNGSAHLLRPMYVHSQGMTTLGHQATPYVASVSDAEFRQ